MTHELQGDDRINFLTDARELLDWLEARPEIPLHRCSAFSIVAYDSWVEQSGTFDDEGVEHDKPPRVFTPGKVARAMGKADKSAGYTFSLSREFGLHRYSYLMERDGVCTARVVGEKDIIESVPTNLERIAELQAEIESLHEERVIGTEPIIEYDCPKSLLSEAA